MVKDTLNSILDNIKERTTNPFLGTLIVVWLVKNWSLVYSLFYFDNSLKLEARLKYISAYFADHSFLLNMIFVILITLGVLVLTYILLGVSRYLTDTYERRLVPRISNWTDATSIVLKTDYLKLQDVIKQLEIRLEEERVTKVAAQKERDDAYLKLITLQTSANNASSQTESNGQGFGDKKISDSQNDERTFRRLAETISRNSTYSEFNQTVGQIMSNTSFQKTDPVIGLLLREVIIKMNEEHNSQLASYVFTDEGVRFLKYWNNYEISEDS